MLNNPEIFRDYDIRGVYGRDFDEEFAFKLGLALVAFSNRKRFLVANDGRDFSGNLAESLIKGITAAGGDADYLGLATTPLFNFAFGKYQANGGVMITGSHNPGEYGGFKIFDWQGNPIGRSNGLTRINELIRTEALPAAKAGGWINNLDRPTVRKEYAKFIVRKSGVSSNQLKSIKFKISGPEAVLEEAGALFKLLGLQNAETDFEMFFTFDGDADRVMIFDRNNQLIQADHIVGLLVKDAVRFLSKPKVVHDLRFSRGVTAKMAEWGIKTFRSKVGRTHVRSQMIKHRADIGGELSGHVYFKETNFHELPLLLILKILKIIVKSKMAINELIKPFQTWFSSGEINFEIADSGVGPLANYRLGGNLPAGDLFKSLKQKYNDGEFDELDGLTVQYPDWWFNLRPSNTEPLLRLVVEARDQAGLKQKVLEISELITLLSPRL